MADTLGEDTRLQYESATPGTYTTIAQVTSIEGPEREREAVPKTHLGSTAKEYRGSKIPDNGEVSFVALFDPANATHEKMEELFASGDTVNWRLVFNNDTNSRPHRQFAGFLTNWKPTGMEVDSNVEMNVTIKITGDISEGTTTLS